MKEQQNETYGLYLVKPEDIGPDETHFLITAKWSLLYTKNEPPREHREITDLKALPGTALRWLDETITEIRRAYLEENRQEILAFAKSFNEVFEKELAQERLMMAEDENGKDTDQTTGGV